MPRNKIVSLKAVKSENVNSFSEINSVVYIALKSGFSFTSLDVLPKSEIQINTADADEGIICRFQFEGKAKTEPSTGEYVVLAELADGSTIYIGTPQLPVRFETRQQIADGHYISLSFSWKYHTVLRGL